MLVAPVDGRYMGNQLIGTLSPIIIEVENGYI